MEGDRAVGGIAGSMAIELDTDPAGHWEAGGDETAAGLQLQLSAGLADCFNTGSVTAKFDGSLGGDGLEGRGIVANERHSVFLFHSKSTFQQ